MFRLMDRQLIAAYIKAYLICLVSMMGLFIVVDLFTNLDNFTEGKETFRQVIEHILAWYGMKIAQIFDRLSEAVVLLAAMFTVALLQRNNELLPMLSAGVSTRRVVRPVLLAAFLMLGLSIVNQEFVLPRIDPYMAESRDFKGNKETGVQGGYEPNGIIITGKSALKKDLTVQGFACVFPPKLGQDRLISLQAKEARYYPEKKGWILTETIPAEISNWTNPDLLEYITRGTYFLRHERHRFRYPDPAQILVHVLLDLESSERTREGAHLASCRRRGRISHALDASHPRYFVGLHGPVHHFGRSKPQHLFQHGTLPGAMRGLFHFHIPVQAHGRQRSPVARLGGVVPGRPLWAALLRDV